MPTGPVAVLFRDAQGGNFGGVELEVGFKNSFYFSLQLLPDLKYNDLMSVFIVHNGKFISDSHIFVRDQMIEAN